MLKPLPFGTPGMPIQRKLAYASLTPSKNESTSATRKKLLDFAEKLFAKHGANGVSIRNIADAAQVNLGAINYHFGSKHELVMAVFSRRLKAVNSARIARLDALERKAGKRPVKIRDIMDAMIRPAMEGPGGGVNHTEAVTLLLSRSHCEQDPAVKKFVHEQFEEVVRRFDASLVRTMKGFTPNDVYWRMIYLAGALNLAQEAWLGFADRPFPGHMNDDGTSDLRRPGRETFIREIVDFFAGGFTATRIRVKRELARPNQAR